MRRTTASNQLVAISAADPLNLVGTLLPGQKVPALTTNRIAYRDGEAVAALVAGEMHWLAALDPAAIRAVEDVLVKRQAGSPRLAYLR
jgi:ATP-dependent Lhr-like helicase